MTVLEIVADVASRLESLGIRYAIGGSLASSAWGQMRQTNDADIEVYLSPSHIEPLTEAFHDPYLLSKSELQNAVESAAPFRSVQLINMDEAFKVDLFLLDDSEYSMSELDRVVTVNISGTTPLKLLAPENIVIAKLRWFQLGNQVSDRQWNDIVSVLETQRGMLDIEYLSAWSRQFLVSDLLDQALSEVDGST